MRILSAIFFFCICFSAQAKKPGRVFLDFAGGNLIGGPLSHQHYSLSGNHAEISFGYVWFPSRIGIAPQVGFSRIVYKQDFSRYIFLQHQQSGISIQLPVLFQLNDHFRLRTGIQTFLPFYHVVLIGEKHYQVTSSFSDDPLNNAYHRSSVQAGPMLGLDYTPGKKQLVSIGFLVTQMGISPVRSDVTYTDASGTNLTVSRQLKPMYFSLHLSLALTKAKTKEKKD